MRKRRESARGTRGVSLDMPDRFRDGDDANDDVTAPKRTDTMSMNQSLFSMIARAGQQSQVDLGRMEEVDSGESDQEDKAATRYHSLDGAARLSRLSTANDFTAQTDDSAGAQSEKSKHRRGLSENKLLRTLPKLKLSGKKDTRSESHDADQMSSSQFLPPKQHSDNALPRVSSMAAQRNEPQVTEDQDLQIRKIRSSGQRSRHGSSASKANTKAPVTLAKRIQHIFDFSEVEDVISEYPCWLLQSILLQGYMYITQKHVCFYAYIPKKHVSLLSVRFSYCLGSRS